MAKSKISWTDEAVNFYDWHCDKVSPGCKFCYAERDQHKYGKGLSFVGAPDWRKNSEQELRLTKPGTVLFINTHSDTYHKGATPEMVQRIHVIAAQRPDLIFLMLTKRPENAEKFYDLLHGELPFPDNLWMGVSVESVRFLERLDVLRTIPAAHRFVSFEPLLQNIPLDYAFKALTSIEWAIVGGESGEFHRPFDHNWARGIFDVCRKLGIPFFFKQSSGLFPDTGRTFQVTGSEHNERPEAFHLLHEAYKVKVDQLSLF